MIYKCSHCEFDLAADVENLLACEHEAIGAELDDLIRMTDPGAAVVPIGVIHKRLIALRARQESK